MEKAIALTGGNQVLRQHGFNIRKSSKVPRIERYNLIHAMNAHSCNQPCIMYLRSGHTVVHQHPAPFTMHFDVIGQEAEVSLYPLCQIIRVSWREAIAVSLCGTCQGVPKFAYILRCEVEVCAGSHELD